MEQRVLGRTGLRVSALGFGCGDVGGLIVRGTPAERERAVARAVEAGINYFDTASSYGSGESERNLGQTLKAIGVRPYVGTKFRLDPAETDLAAAIARSLEASLQRLGLDSVDLFQLHNLIVAPDGAPAPGRGLPARRVLDEVVPALAALRRQGKIRFAGITALGDTGAVHTVLDAGVIDTAQVCLNLLNPSAAVTGRTKTGKAPVSPWPSMQRQKISSTTPMEAGVASRTADIPANAAGSRRWTSNNNAWMYLVTPNAASNPTTTPSNTT